MGAVPEKHWMDAENAIYYVDFVVSQYPGRKILIIWDYAGAHIDASVKAYMDSKGVGYMFIDSELTSVMQPCDLWANQPFKGCVHEDYFRWRQSLTLSARDKVKVSRKRLAEWIEHSAKQMITLHWTDKAVAKEFSHC